MQISGFSANRPAFGSASAGPNRNLAGPSSQETPEAHYADKLDQGDLDQIMTWLSGEFNTKESHEKDPANYQAIDTKIVRIWPEEAKGYWFYSQHTIPTMSDKPFRQAIYHMEMGQKPDEILTQNYQFKDKGQKAEAADHWRDSDFLHNLSPADFELKPGDFIYRKNLDQGVYEGNTIGKSCVSTYNGAAYVKVSEDVGPEGYVGWETGYNAQDQWVWGAKPEAPPYVYRKTFNIDPKISQ